MQKNDAVAYAIEMINITKRFPGVVANDHVCLHVRDGEIHGLIGENGAGKSTIMNVLYGLEKPDEGIIRIFGKETAIHSPEEAIRLQIGMVHQHFMLMPNLTVLQNIILGHVPKRFGFIDRRKAAEEIEGIMSAYDLSVDLGARIDQLSVGQKQRVEIVKSLYRGARIFVLDEPTAVLTPSEIDKLMEILARLKQQGCSIVFITHKLNEVMQITDNITVMRKGIVTGRVAKVDTTPSELSQLMVGREVDLKIKVTPYSPGKEVLRLSNVCALSRRGLPALGGVSLSVHEGEIVGIAGVEGNGQTELVDVVAGMAPVKSGEIRFCGRRIDSLSVRRRRDLGMSHIPEDRLRVGVAKSCTIKDNLVLNRYYQKPFCRTGILDGAKLGVFAEQLCGAYQVKTPDAGYRLGTLSGGNMQKVIFAREAEVNADLMIAAQPTRGIDIGSIEYIHNQIAKLRDSGKAILLVSAELEEVMSLSDRILVIYEGQIVAQFRRGEATRHEIGMYMLGSKRMTLSEDAL